jgi:hypothetical protein
MEWQVQLHPSFEPEFLTLPQEAQDELLAKTLLLQISELNLPLFCHSSQSKMDECSINPQNQRHENRDRQRQLTY